MKNENEILLTVFLILLFIFNFIAGYSVALPSQCPIPRDSWNMSQLGSCCEQNVFVMIALILDLFAILGIWVYKK